MNKSNIFISDDLINRFDAAGAVVIRNALSSRWACRRLAQISAGDGKRLIEDFKEPL